MTIQTLLFIIGIVLLIAAHVVYRFRAVRGLQQLSRRGVPLRWQHVWSVQRIEAELLSRYPESSVLIVRTVQSVRRALLSLVIMIIWVVFYLCIRLWY